MEDDYQIAMDAIKDQADGEYEAYHAAASEQQQWDQLQNELATLRAELAETRQAGFTEVDWWSKRCEAATARAEKAEAEAAALRAHVERMRKAFKRIITTDENGNSMTWPQIDEMVRPLLAAAPAQSVKGDPDEKHV